MAFQPFEVELKERQVKVPLRLCLIVFCVYSEVLSFKTYIFKRAYMAPYKNPLPLPWNSLPKICTNLTTPVSKDYKKDTKLKLHYNSF